MRDIRSGNDIPLRWTVNGLDEVQGNRIVQLINSDSGHVARFDPTIAGNVISGTFYGKDQRELGEYRLILYVNRDHTEMVTLDKVRAFKLWDVCDWGIVRGEDDAGLEVFPIEIESDISAPVPYYKPVDGIPATDLDAAVQAALEKALSALQPDGVKTINGQSIVGHGNIVIQGGAGGDSRPEVIITDERNVTLDEGKYYVFGECEELTINIGDQYTDGRLNKYMFEFDSPQDAATRLSLPANLRNVPSFAIVPGSHFVVAIQGNVVSMVGTNSYYPGAGDEEFFKDFFNRDIVKVVIPEGVGTITRYLFYQCVSLTHVVLPSTLSAVETYAFSGCLSLTTINFPEGLTTIGDRAFESCTALAGILNLPTTLKNIGQYGFSSCRSLTKIIIPEGVTNIGTNAFYSCAGVTEVELPSTYVQFGTSVFSGIGVTSFTIPSWLTVIPGSFLSSCKSLTSVTIPNTVTLLQASVFSGCSVLRSITLPNSVVELQASVFNQCTLLTDVTIHDSITTVVSASSFSGIGANAKFKIIGTTRVIPFMTMPNTTQVYVDSTMVARYKTASGWSGIASRIFSLSDLE